MLSLFYFEEWKICYKGKGAYSDATEQEITELEKAHGIWIEFYFWNHPTLGLVTSEKVPDSEKPKKSIIISELEHREYTYVGLPDRIGDIETQIKVNGAWRAKDVWMESHKGEWIK